MTIKPNRVLGAVAVAVSCASASLGAHALNLSGLPATAYDTYGNANVYSLPSLAVFYDATVGGGTGPGNPYYIASSPGQIKDLVVIYTGASGTGVTTNAAGFEDSYLTPSGKTPDFANTVGAVNVDAPAVKPGIAHTTVNSWDASVSAMQTFLGVGGTPIFFFNNNETNNDQNLAIWAKAWITDPSGSLYGQYLYLANDGANAGHVPQLYGQGGVNGGDATLFNPGNISPVVNVDGTTDYVLAGGQTCLDAAFMIVPCDGSGGAVAYTINHNLGANQAAYAATVPLLDAELNALFTTPGIDLSTYTFHLELALGCDPQWGRNCANLAIDNGYEQLFMGSTTTNYNPEPATVALLGIGLLGLGAMRRRNGA